MKVLGRHTRVSIIALVVFTIAVAGIGLNGIEEVGFDLSSVGGSVEAASAPALPLCPPTTIDGVVGSGSTDYPFTTGQQTSRLFRNSIESTCGTAKAVPSLSDAGIQFTYDAYEFNNLAQVPICVTVITAAGANNQILTAAYLESFNPANVQENYLGDAGNSDSTRAFSFIVPTETDFVIVQSRVNNAGNPPSLAYSFRVLGMAGCEGCPPTQVSGTIGSAGSTLYPAASGNQVARLFRDAEASTCDLPKTSPGLTDEGSQFAYHAYTFLNRSGTPACVTISATAGGANQILTAAYLNRFNPFDVEENYLGDAGNSDQGRTFSVIVPGKRTFVVVVSRVNNAQNPTSLAYNFSLSGLSGCGCVATLSKTSESFAANGGTGSVNVTIPQGCAWSVSDFSTAVNVTSGSSGNGNGTVNYSVAANATTNPVSGTLAIAGKTFQVFEGIEFADVPLGAPFYTEIGKLSARRVTLGCGTGIYCPNQTVTREQMAAFIIRALGDLSVPFPQQQRFDDVPPQNGFYGFIEQMALRQITLGCSTSPALYCPIGSVTREQMAAFLIRAKGEFNPPNPANQRFVDVPPSNPFYRFIDRMAVLGITQGCATNPAQYCPGGLVTRDQMAAFLVRAFGL